MALVDYLDSDSDQQDEADAEGAQLVRSSSKSTIKRKRSEAALDALPPLPAAFHDLYATNARVGTNDDPSLHGGRKRTIPHVEGNWPSHIYLEWIPSQTESTELHSLIQHTKISLEHQNAVRTKKLAIPEIVPSLQSDLGAPLPLHVSLSRTLQIKTGDRADFVAALSSSLKATGVHVFPFEFQGLKWVSNFQRNRWFLVLSIKRPAHDELNRLLNTCNRVVQNTGHPRLYAGEGDNPMKQSKRENKLGAHQKDEAEEVDQSEFFHVSIAWNLEEPDVRWVSFVEKMDISKLLPPLQVAIDAVKLKIGNAIHSILLKR